MSVHSPRLDHDTSVSSARPSAAASQWSSTLAQRLAESAVRLHQPPDLRGVAEAVVREARLINSADGAALLLRQRGHLRPVAASDPSVWHVTDIEARCHEGPGLNPQWNDGVCRVRAVASEHRWPRWAEHVAALGWLSLLSVRLTTLRLQSGSGHSDTAASPDIGVLNLYFRTTTSPPGQLETAQTFAVQANLAVLHALGTPRVQARPRSEAGPSDPSRQSEGAQR